MGRIGHGYGSEWQLMWYLARHRDELSREVAQSTGLESLMWHDFRGASQKGCDSEWKGLDFLGRDRPDVIEAWAQRWPSRGNQPNWDAIGTAARDGAQCWLLVEAKAHTAELKSDCSASDGRGRSLIADTLADVQRQLNVSPDRDWLRGYYQYCNRLAVLQFLRNADIPAKLVLVYFYGDFAKGRECPGSPDGWNDALLKQEEHVGLPVDSPIRSVIHKVFLPAFKNLHE